MKIHYSKKTDYLEFFFRTDHEYYETEDDLGPFAEFRSCVDESLVGYGIDDAFDTLHTFNKIDSSTKLALYSWMIRKIHKLTQEELAELIDEKSSRTIQRVENAEVIATIDYPIVLKKIEPRFDLNFIT